MLAKGDLVTHPAMPAWGIGKVMKIVQDGNLLVKFEGAGRKLLQPHSANLLKFADDELLYLVVWKTKIKRGRAVRTFRAIPVVKRSSI